MLVSFRGRTAYQVQKELVILNKAIIELKTKLNMKIHQKDGVLEEMNSFNVVKSEPEFEEFVKSQKVYSDKPEPFIDYEFPNPNNCPHLFMK